ncbi:Killer toxin subunits alpha/beta [Tolypocladium paradoxum]|uniref:chitinase n=1 Tax=Tolypocladium paradoxum TaxID=94208 RepID=A0A2S4LAS4_9HYPO|nr:Killer toxin subunits alpha/beta [Tolypocladium paradoxum]
MLTNPTLALAALSFVLGGALAVETALHRAAGLYECPELCSVTGPNTSNWTRFASNNDLKWCKNETMLLSLPVHIPLSDTNTHSVFHACLSSRSGEVHARVRDVQKRAVEGLHMRSEVSFLQSSAKSSLPNFGNDASTAIKELQAKYLDVVNSDTNQTVYFAKLGDSAVGVYVGGDVQKQSIAVTLMQKLEDYVSSSSGLAQTALFQLCGEGRNADSVAGVVVDGRGGLDSVFAVQEFVRTWAESRCVTDVDGSSKTETIAIAYVSADALPGQNGTAADRKRAISPRRRSTSSSAVYALDRRADCEVTQVLAGDSCGSLASKCKLSDPDFTELHPESDFCSSLTPGQWVCCSSGPLPDMKPKQNPDGLCYSYTVLAGDSCAKIAAAHSLEQDDIEKLNNNTWGFSGCNSLWPDMHICLSAGDPPMPAAVASAKCGPQVPGTKQPAEGTKLADLNPCPLNACCNVWGQCGTTEDFCIEASLGPPGTSKPGQNGCISNCGMDIVNNHQGPAQQITVGYYEAWNQNRTCLHMDVTQMSKSISHIHFAFVDVTAGFVISTANVQEQWDTFKGMSGHHKVAVFGGWAASTEPTSYWIFREGVKPENRETLATNLVNFITSNNMDGIDLDWEYPGAQDIPGVPAADPFDGAAYVELLKLLRQKLGNDKSISIAAPGMPRCRFWITLSLTKCVSIVLNFPIAEISKIVDYIVYMTYDLHGQWDYGSKWSLPGCDGVSCLRSHINITETVNSLSMITKAGVPSNKIVVGVASYGRSFQMTKAGCTGPQCGFTGPQSTAKEGRCTDTRGYISNAEIDEIIISGSPGGKRAGAVQQFTDDDSGSQILVYDDTNWVAYMDDGNKAARKAKWTGLNFAGTTDWAVDLATFTPGDNNPQCWLSKQCMSPGANDTSQKSTWRWDQLCTNEAWNAAMGYYNKSKGSDQQSFPRSISNFFHGPASMDCDVLATENGCHSFVQCIQGVNTGPAGTFILNGFVSISNVSDSLWPGKPRL